MAATPGQGPVEEYNELAENLSGYDKVWQERLGNNSEANTGNPNGYSTWSQLSLLVSGILIAGDDLTWDTWAAGVESARPHEPNRCTVARFMGRDYHWDVAFDRRADASLSRVGFTTLYWVNEQTPFGTNGYWESFDNYRKFTPETLPPQATHDTGEKGVDIDKQERIGIRPWTPCSKFPNYPLSWD